MNYMTPWRKQFAEQLANSNKSKSLFVSGIPGDSQAGSAWEADCITIELIAPDTSYFARIWEKIGRVDHGCFGIESGRVMLHGVTFSGSNPEMPMQAELEAKFAVASIPWNQTIDLASKPAPYDSADFAAILDAIEVETRKMIGLTPSHPE